MDDAGNTPAAARRQARATPQPRPSGEPIRIGIDSFAFHRFFGETNQWEQPVREHWSLEQLLELATALRVEVISVQTIHLPDRGLAALERLGREMSSRDLDRILAWGHRSGLEDGRNPDKLRDALASLEAARALGCTVIRVVCGDHYSWSPDPASRAAQHELLVSPLAALAREAERLGICVAVENHADCTVAELASLVEAVGSAHLGLCLDIGNAARVGEDPVSAARAARGSCLMSHLRDLRVVAESRGDPTSWWPCVTLGAGDLAIPAVLAELIGAPRCDAWLIETSNVLPGCSEHEIVETSLRYLRDWLGRSTPTRPSTPKAG